MKEIYENAIYKHFKGDYYRVVTICYHESFGIPYVVYHKCDENGIFISIRVHTGTILEKIVKQPFLRELETFAGNVSNSERERFTFIKQL